MTDEVSIDLTNTPFLREMLGVRSDGDLSESQIERIGYRAEVIHSLTRAIEQSTDQAFIKRAATTIEEKKMDIYRIAAEGECTPNAETIAAFKELETGGGELFHGPADEILERILNEDDEPPQSPAAGQPPS